MIKKKVCAGIAAALALLSFPAALAVGNFTTVQRTYTAGYTTLNYNYFYTGTLSKPSTDRWETATDDNTETVFVDSNGNETTGSHWTKIYSGTTLVHSGDVVTSGATKNFAVPTAYNNYTTLRLRISNLAQNGEGYKTKGTFKAKMFNYE